MLASNNLSLVYPEATRTKVREFSSSSQRRQMPTYQLYNHSKPTSSGNLF